MCGDRGAIGGGCDAVGFKRRVLRRRVRACFERRLRWCSTAGRRHADAAVGRRSVDAPAGLEPAGEFGSQAVALPAELRLDVVQSTGAVQHGNVAAAGARDERLRTGDGELLVAEPAALASLKKPLFILAVPECCGRTLQAARGRAPERGRGRVRRRSHSSGAAARARPCRAPCPRPQRSGPAKGFRRRKSARHAGRRGA